MEKVLRFGLYGLFAFGFLNLIALDFIVSKNLTSKDQAPAVKETIVEKTADLGSLACPSSCISQIKEATASIKLVQPTPLPQPQAVSQSISGEFFIPLGSGTNSTNDWADLAGVQAYVDSTKYGRIKSVVFEASLRIPTGNETAYARLFNVTDKHPVWFSEVSLDGGTPKLLISQPITLDLGNKLYQVQMKTSLKFPAVLDQARIHITSY